MYYKPVIHSSMVKQSKSAPTNEKSCDTMMILVPCKPERTEFADT